jgi:SAM-dependent methyltransferase
MGNCEIQAVHLEPYMSFETCMNCGSTRFSDSPTVSQRFRLKQCQTCGVAVTDPMPSPEDLEGHYSRAYYGPENVKFVSALEKIVDWVTQSRARQIDKKLQKRSRILEIGCGRGTLLSALGQLGHECYGTERSALAATRARRITGIKVYTEPLEQGHLQQNYFDLVILWHVLEHLENPAETLRHVFKLLKTGGLLMVEVPNLASLQSRLSGKHWFHLDIERHLYHFTTKGFRLLIERAGFQVVEERTFSWEQCPFGVLQSFLNCLGLKSNAFYGLLKKETLPLFEKLLQYLLAGLFVLPATVFAVLESALDSGGVINVTAKKSLIVR